MLRHKDRFEHDQQKDGSEDPYSIDTSPLNKNPAASRQQTDPRKGGFNFWGWGIYSNPYMLLIHIY
jgi:hypothetical protein